MLNFTYNNLEISIYEGIQEAPLVLIHEDHGEGEAVWGLLEKAGVSCTLACIRGMKWNRDLAPWDAPASFKKGEPFIGGGEAHLHCIVREILPEIERQTGHEFSEKYIGGYSLAGLFAMYSTYLTEVFAGFVSASGSMWFPEFLEYVKSHTISENVEKAYFSIGDKEGKTKNPVMKCVEENTREIEQYLKEKGIKTIFELNQGGHFVDDDLRLAKGIQWILGGNI